jgi:hypothetical protein
MSLALEAINQLIYHSYAELGQLQGVPEFWLSITYHQVAQNLGTGTLSLSRI